MQRQMTINGYNNGLWFFFFFFLCTVNCFVFKNCCDNIYGSLMSTKAHLSGTRPDNVQSKASDTVDVVSGNV